MGRPASSGAMRLWAGILALSLLALAQMLFLGRFEGEGEASVEGGHSGRLAGRGASSVQGKPNVLPMSAAEDETDESDASLGTMFPALNHLISRKGRKKAGAGKKEELEGEAEQLRERLSTHTARMDEGYSDPSFVRSVQKDLAHAAEVEGKLRQQSGYAQADAEASALLKSLGEGEGKGAGGAGELQPKGNHLGSEGGWLHRFRRLFAQGAGGMDGAVLLDVLLRLLEVPRGSFLEIAAGAEDEASVPLAPSPFPFLRDYRLWEGVTVGPTRRKEDAQISDPLMRRRCQETPQHYMCWEAVTPENLVPLVQSLKVPRDLDVLGSVLGTLDFYLVAALLRAGYAPKVVLVSYNRNFGTPDSYAVLPELGNAWTSDCYFSASALALQRLLKKHEYTVVAGDASGSYLLFVRNSLLPSDAQAPTLWSQHWLAQVVPTHGALFRGCDGMSWNAVSESAIDEGKAWEPSLRDQVVLHEQLAERFTSAKRSGTSALSHPRGDSLLGSPPASAGVEPAGDAVLGDSKGYALAASREGARVRSFEAVREPACAAEGPDVLVHAGSLLRRAGDDGIVRWYNQDGNAMLQSEARKRVKNHQEATENMTAAGGDSAREWFADNWHESVSCSIHAKVGDSFICDPQRLSKCGCLVYSFDDAGHGNFERDLHRHAPHCTVHSFDNGIGERDPLPGVIFHRSSAVGSKETRSLKTQMRLLGHGAARFDILRIHVKSAEYAMIEEAAADGSLATLAQQILLKVHFPFSDEESAAALAQRQREAHARRKNSSLDRLRSELQRIKDKLEVLTAGGGGEDRGRLGPGVDNLYGEFKGLENRITDLTSGRNSDSVNSKKTNPSAIKAARLAHLLHNNGFRYAVFSKIPDLHATDDRSFSVEYSLVSRDYLPAHR